MCVVVCDVVVLGCVCDVDCGCVVGVGVVLFG